MSHPTEVVRRSLGGPEGSESESSGRYGEAGPLHHGRIPLPVEIYQKILHLSVDEELNVGPTCYIRRIVALQSVSRAFRDVVRSTPEFWSYLSSSIPQLFDLQLERSKNRDLLLHLFTSDYRDDSKVPEIFRLYARRWQDINITVRGREASGRLLRDQLSSLTLENVTRLKIGYVQAQRLKGPLDKELSELFESLIGRMPNISRLYLTNFLPPTTIKSGLTFLSLVVAEDGAGWAGFRLPSFIACQPQLSKLRLLLRARPSIYGMSEYSTWSTERTYDGKRDLDVSIVLEGTSWTRVLSPIWTAIGLIGIARLSIDLSRASNDAPSGRGFCEALHLSTDRLVPGLQSLTLTFCESQESEWVCFGQHSLEYEHELPSSLRILKVHNCTSSAFGTIRSLIERLLQQRAALRDEFASTRLQVTASGVLPSVQDHLQLETLLGRGNVQWG